MFHFIGILNDETGGEVKLCVKVNTQNTLSEFRKRASA